MKKPEIMDLAKALLWLENVGQSVMPDEAYEALRKWVGEKTDTPRADVYKLGADVYSRLALEEKCSTCRK